MKKLKLIPRNPDKSRVFYWLLVPRYSLCHNLKSFAHLIGHLLIAHKIQHALLSFLYEHPVEKRFSTLRCMSRDHLYSSVASVYFSERILSIRTIAILCKNSNENTHKKMSKSFYEDAAE